MSSESKIEWTQSTWNPLRGCSRVSEGCRLCYAERVAARFSDEGMPYAGLATRTPSGPRWTGEVRLVEERLEDPLRWIKPRRIFVNSMSDLFHERVHDGIIWRIFDVMRRAPRHTFQILTKRPERMACWFRDLPNAIDVGRGEWPYSHVHLGVSVEDQRTADERIPHLLATPAAVRFVSYEPALGPVTFRQNWRDWLEGWDTEAEHDPGCDGDCSGGGCPVPVQVQTPRIDWVIAGGESGPGARPAHPSWFRDIRDQCAGAGVPFFFKQWGEWAPSDCGLTADDAPWAARTLDDGTTVRRVGKARAGRLLDGRTWDEYPNTP